MLETERLVLRLMEVEDEDVIVSWRNKKEIIDGFFSHKGPTLTEHREWYQRYLKGGSRLEFVIRIKESGKRIGTIGLNNLDFLNQKAEYGILIGEDEAKGKGYGEEASIALLKYAFEELNLHRIYLRVFTVNSAAIRLYEKLGFEKEGILRQDAFKNGRYQDVLMMAIMRGRTDA